MQPFFTYFGGKWRSAPYYPAPRHKTIIEPFAGAAGYSVRHSKKDIILIEKDARVARVWRYLINATSKQILALPLTIETMARDLDIEPAAQDLIGFWLNKGTTAPSQTPSKWMRGTQSGASSYWGPTIRDRIATQVSFIKHWHLIEGDYTQSPDIPATWFIDPPYQHAGVFYKE